MQCFFVTSEGWTPSNTFEVVGEIYRELSPEERGPCGNDDFAASMAWRIQGYALSIPLKLGAVSLSHTSKVVSPGSNTKGFGVFCFRYMLGR